MSDNIIIGKCIEGDCGFLEPLTCDICCFHCNDKDRCKFSCVNYDEDENYEYSKCDKYKINSEEDK